MYRWTKAAAPVACIPAGIARAGLGAGAVALETLRTVVRHLHTVLSEPKIGSLLAAPETEPKHPPDLGVLMGADLRVSEVAEVSKLLSYAALSRAQRNVDHVETRKLRETIPFLPQ